MSTRDGQDSRLDYGEEQLGAPPVNEINDKKNVPLKCIRGGQGMRQRKVPLDMFQDKYLYHNEDNSTSGNRDLSPVRVPRHQCLNEDNSTSGTSDVSPAHVPRHQYHNEDNSTSGIRDVSSVRVPRYQCLNEDNSKSGIRDISPVRVPRYQCLNEDNSKSGIRDISPVRVPRYQYHNEDNSTSGIRDVSSVRVPRYQYHNEDNSTSGIRDVSPVRVPRYQCLNEDNSKSGIRDISPVRVPRYQCLNEDNSTSGIRDVSPAHVPRHQYHNEDNSTSGIRDVSPVRGQRYQYHNEDNSTSRIRNISPVRVPRYQCHNEDNSTSGNRDLSPVRVPRHQCLNEDNSTSGTSDVSPAHVPRHQCLNEDSSKSGIRDISPVRVPRYQCLNEDNSKSGIRDVSPAHVPRHQYHNEDNSTSGIRDVSPVRGQRYQYHNEDNSTSRIRNISPVRVPRYQCHNEDNSTSGIRDISPVYVPRDQCHNEDYSTSGIRDLSPVRGKRYQYHNEDNSTSRIRDISPVSVPRYQCHNEDNSTSGTRDVSSVRVSGYQCLNEDSTSRIRDVSPVHAPRYGTGEITSELAPRNLSNNRDELYRDSTVQHPHGRYLSYLNSRYGADEISPECAPVYQRYFGCQSRSGFQEMFPGRTIGYHRRNGDISNQDSNTPWIDISCISDLILRYGADEVTLERAPRFLHRNGVDNPNYEFDDTHSAFALIDQVHNGDNLRYMVSSELVPIYRHRTRKNPGLPPSYADVAAFSERPGRQGLSDSPSYLETNIDEQGVSSGSEFDDDAPELTVREILMAPPSEPKDPSEDNGLTERESKSHARTRAMVEYMRSESQSTIAGAEAVELEMMNVDCEETEEEEDHQSETQQPRPIRRLSMDVALAESSIDGHTSELGQPRRRSRESDTSYECTVFPILTPPYSYVRKALQRTSGTKKILIFIGVFVILGLLLLVSLLPASFVYVNYYEIGFTRNKVTGAHDYSQVYDVGCYLLAPQDEIVRFNAIAHTLALELTIMNSIGMNIGLDFSMQYFIRPEELHILFQKYHIDYPKVIESVVESTVKNTAIDYTMDQYRLNRSVVEAGIFQEVRQALSGDCCALCCPSCFSAKIKCGPGDCKTTNCSSGYHVDVLYFQLGRVTIPKLLMEKYERQVLLQIAVEKELFLQRGAVQRKKTEYKVSLQLNAAHEIREAAKAKAHIINTKAKALLDKDKQIAYTKSLKKFFSHLNITTEEDQINFMYIKTLKDVSHNLYAFSYSYDKNTLWNP